MSNKECLMECPKQSSTFDGYIITPVPVLHAYGCLNNISPVQTDSFVERVNKVFKQQGISLEVLELANYSRIAEICRKMTDEPCFCGCHITELTD